MKRFVNALVLTGMFLAFMTGVGNASRQRWMIRPFTEVSRSAVTLRDLLLSPEALDKLGPGTLNHVVLRVPNPGEAHVTRGQLLSEFRSFLGGTVLASLQVPTSGVTIRRVFRIDTGEVVEVFKKVIFSRYGGLGRIHVRDVKISGNTQIPSPYYRIVAYAPARFRKVMNIKMKVLGKGWRRTIFARGRVSITATVLVAKRYITKGEKIGPDNTTLIEQDITHLYKSYLTSARQCEGLVARSSIPEGHVISPENLTSPILVNNGAIVTIQAQSPNILVRTLGVAKQRGRRGDIIRVENLQSKKIIYAKVTAKNLVTVEF